MASEQRVCVPHEQVVAVEEASSSGMELPRQGSGSFAVVPGGRLHVASVVVVLRLCVCGGTREQVHRAGDSEQIHTGPNHSVWTASRPQIPGTQCSRTPQRPHPPCTCLQTRLETREGRAVAFPPQGQQVDRTISWSCPPHPRQGQWVDHTVSCRPSV